MVDRDLWRNPAFTRENLIRLPCPYCFQAALTLDQESLKTGSTAATVLNSSLPQWDHLYWTGVFCCLLKCNNLGCGGAISVTGEAYMCEGELGKDSAPFRPLQSHPSFIASQLPEGTPENIRRHFEISCGAMWVDRSGSLNHLRVALELLLDKLRIPRHSINKAKHKRNRISLHDRIQRIRAAKYQGIRASLMALKWIGNDGSHGADPSLDDVFDGMDILEDVVSKCFTSHHKELASVVNEINRRKGTRKRRGK